MKSVSTLFVFISNLFVYIVLLFINRPLFVIIMISSTYSDALRLLAQRETSKIIERRPKRL